MAVTPVFGFDYESPEDLPGETLTGGQTGLHPILAIQVEQVLQGLQTGINDNADAIAALDARVTALENPLDVAEVATGNTAASLELTVPATYVQGSLRIVGRARTNENSGGFGRSIMTVGINNDSAAAHYRQGSWFFNAAAGLVTIAQNARNDNWTLQRSIAANDALSNEMGDVVINLFYTPPGSPITSRKQRIQAESAVAPDTTDANIVWSKIQGRTNATDAIETIQLSASGDFVGGTRFELWPG